MSGIWKSRATGHGCPRDYAGLDLAASAVMLPTRWSSLARYGLLGNTLLGLAAGRVAAEPCDDVAARSVSIVLGVELSPRARLIGGIEARQCLTDKTEAMVRAEFGGGTRLIFGARARPFESPDKQSDAEQVGLEAGVVLASHNRIDVHIAGTYGPHFLYAALQGHLPLNQVDRPFHLGLVGALSPTALRPQGMVVNGRPLSTAGRHLCPDVIGGLCEVRSREEQIVRDHFVSSAQLELSSVWTFLRLAAELATVGAPEELVLAALDAADDEVRHAELCAGAAGGVVLAALAASAAQPRFTTRTAHALGVLASEAWLEGCLNEGAAAEEARIAGKEARGSIAGMLASIACDESRHAELSWAVLSWVSSIAPDVVESIELRVPEAPSDGPSDHALAQHGVPSRAVTAAAWDTATSAARSRLISVG